MRRENNRRGRYSGSDRSGFRSSFNSNWSNQRPRQMHNAICTACGDECEVPFKPTEGKPVYCKACFNKNKRF